MNTLQQLESDTDIVVTLGGADVDPERVLARMTYHHPVYTPEALAAQRLLPNLDSDRIAYAGAYHGWGFHEDGCRSGAQAAVRLGGSW
jgi:predicted NAD/FAD-binding protein